MSVEDHAIRVRRNQIVAMSDSGNSVRLSGVGSREADGTTRDNGRYSVFVNHLGHGIAQQDHILIKRFNLPLQFDSVNQIDGNWDVLTTQCVQERILEKLAFAFPGKRIGLPYIGMGLAGGDSDTIIPMIRDFAERIALEGGSVTLVEFG